MATQKYSLQFRIVDEITLPEEVDRHSADVIKQIIAYAEINDIVPDGFERYDAAKAFNRHDGEDITKTETIVTIIFDADPDAIAGQDNNDAAKRLYVQALLAIKDNTNAKITGQNYREQLPRALTVIEITA